MLRLLDLTQSDDRREMNLLLARLRQTVSLSSEAASTVAQIVEEVRELGDTALIKYMRKWSDPDFTASHIRVRPDEIQQSLGLVDPQLLTAIDRAIDHVHQYQRHIMPLSPSSIRIDRAELGLRFSPVDSAGLTVPGGAAVLFSTLIMLAVPAMAAGVKADDIAVIHPPPTARPGLPAGQISPIVLAVCARLGLSKVYRIGGAQGVAALAFGTESVQPVDMIAGPGNVYVQLAKAMVAGRVGTEGGFYGPSEIVTLADDTADPGCIASDLLAQAEHDPGKCFLISWSRSLLDRVLTELQQQLPQRSRRDAIEKALARDSAAMLVSDADQAVELANAFAAEHVNLAVSDPPAMLKRLRHAGEVFLGDSTPVAAGDYYAGPSHCLPTGTTARFASGVSVYTFLKRTGTVTYPEGLSQRDIEDIAAMARAEGLDAHAASAQQRGSR